MLELNFSLPPSGNHRDCISFAGRRVYKNKAYETWLKRERLAHAGTAKLPDSPIFVFVTVHFRQNKDGSPCKLKQDLDNIVKTLFDGMTQFGIWKDDSLVQTVIASKGEIVPGGSVELWATADCAEFTAKLAQFSENLKVSFK